MFVCFKCRAASGAEKMIIDFHGHLFSEWKGVKGMSTKELIAEMDKNGVAQTVVFTMNGYWGDFRHYNDELIRLTNPYRNRLIPFCTVHPYEVKKAIAELRRCKIKYGIKGVKFHPWLQGFSVTSDEMLLIAEQAAKLEMTLVFHDGTPPYCEPLQIANLAGHCPGLKILLGHGGLKDYYLESVSVVKRFPNVYMGTNPPPSALEKVSRELNGEKIVFGSDVGFDRYCLRHNLNVIRSLSVAPAIKNKIFYKNAQYLLGN